MHYATPGMHYAALGPHYLPQGYIMLPEGCIILQEAEKGLNLHAGFNVQDHLRVEAERKNGCRE